MPPIRRARYCCKDLKESNNDTNIDTITVTGVRWAESTRRKTLHATFDVFGKTTKDMEAAKGAARNSRGGLILNDDNDEARRVVEQCYRTNTVIFNPIVGWSDEDVWEFLNDVAKVPHCCLYDDGVDRIGCIGCPMSDTHRDYELKRWPKYIRLYANALQRQIDCHRDKFPGDLKNERLTYGSATDGEALFTLWMTEGDGMTNVEYYEAVQRNAVKWFGHEVKLPIPKRANGFMDLESDVEDDDE